MTAANEIVSLGLKDVGYSYVNSMSPIDPFHSIRVSNIHLELTIAGLSRMLETMSLDR